MDDRMMEAAGSRRWAGPAVRLIAAAVVFCAVMAGGRSAMGSGLSTGRGTQGYLGVDIRDVSDDQVSVLKLKEIRGAEVVRVDHDGPAGKIGLREHDVILQMNGETIQGQEQLRRMLHETPAGRAVTLVISRDGQQQTLSTQLANREEVERLAWQQHLTVPEPTGFQDSQSGDASVPAGKPSGGDAPAPPPTGMGFFHGGITGGHGRSLIAPMMGGPYTGAVVEPVGAQLAEFFGVKENAGLLVRSVDANSPAATAGLRAGDVVLKANQSALVSPGDWARMMHENRGRAVALTVMREKKEQTLSLTPDAKRRSAMQWPAGPGFAELPELQTDELVASLQPPDEVDVTKMLDDARRQSAAEANTWETMLGDAEQRRREALQGTDLGKLQADALRMQMPDAAAMRRRMDEMTRELEKGRLPEQMD